MSSSQTPLALLCINDSEIEKALKSELDGFEVRSFQTHAEALQQLNAQKFDVAIVYERFVESKTFLAEISRLPAFQRRSMHLVVIGADFVTGEPAQAFQQSADLVLCSSDLAHFGTALRKSLVEKQSFYAPFLDCLAQVEAL